jgi:hypothetical protein
VNTEFLHSSKQPIEFNREDHPITVPRPGNAPLVLEAQIGGYDIETVFMDARSGINLIYAKHFEKYAYQWSSSSQQTAPSMESYQEAPTNHWVE